MSDRPVTHKFCDERTRRIEEKIDASRDAIISGIKSEILPELKKSMNVEVKKLVAQVKKNNGTNSALGFRGWAIVLASFITAISSVAIAVIQSL